MTIAPFEQRYRLYVDESGDHVFHNERTLQEPPHRYLALLGCAFLTSAYIEFQRAFEKFKQEHIPHSPDEPVILHRSDIVNRRGPFWRLRDPSAAENFNRSLLHLVKSADYLVLLVVIDKLKLKTDYPVPWHPYHLALGFLLQRYCFLLNHCNRQGDVLAESRGGREDRLLKNAYDHIYTHGDMHNRASFYQRALTSRHVMLKPKPANIAGLQLADVIAHPLKQAFLANKGKIPTPGGVFGQCVAETAYPKYRRSATDELDGYGRVLFPK